MTRRFHAATFIVSRTCHFPHLLQDKAIRPWFARAVQTRHAELLKAVEAAQKQQMGEEEYYEDDEVFDSEFFIRGLGPFYPYPPRNPLVEGIYQHSRLIVEPFYIPANWRITPAKTLENISASVRLRIHLHQHGVCTLALYCQITHKEGWSGEEFVNLLRGMVDANPREASVFHVVTRGEHFDGTANDILNHALQSVASGLFQVDHREDALTHCRRLEPDHLLLDVGKTSPQLALPEDDEEIAHLLALTTNLDQVVRHDRQPKLGLLKKDWIGANTKHFLFCDTAHPWPAQVSSEGGEHLRGARRNLRKQGRIVWRLYKTVELVRSHRFLADEITKMLQDSNLAMTRAKQLDKDFLKNLFKTTFYDDRLFTLALDIPSAQTKIFGRDKAIFDYLSQVMRLEESEKELKAKVEEFKINIKTWEPTIMNLTDLIKRVKSLF